MKKIDMIIGVLLVIGGLNWGLVGLFNFNLVSAIFGEMTIWSRLIYTLVGLAAAYDIVMIKSIWNRWHLHFQEPKQA